MKRMFLKTGLIFSALLLADLSVASAAPPLIQPNASGAYAIGNKMSIGLYDPGAGMIKKTLLDPHPIATNGALFGAG